MRMIGRVRNLLLGLLLLGCHQAQAQFGEMDLPPSDEQLWAAAARQAKAAEQHNRERYGDDPDMFIRPGLLANRREKWVRIWSRSTIVRYGDAIEFFLIPPDSGKDYEALAVAFTRPSDVHAALEFIGMKPGRPINYAEHQYWPKGERVLMTLEWDQPPAEDQGNPRSTPQRVRAEELILDVGRNQPLPKTGFVFTGSYWFTSEETGRRMYAADVMDSKSIASDFNDTSTVLDVPRLAPKSAVYDTQRLNPAYRFKPGQPVLVTLEPEHKDGRLRVRDLTLRVSMPAGNAGGPPAGKYVLSDVDGKPAADGVSLIHVLAAFGKMTESGLDPYVTVDMDPAMTLRSVRDVMRVLQQLDTENGIRIEAPPAGQLYYRAFFPDEQWRHRDNRLGKPWELHLLEKDRQVAGTLILPADEIDDNDGQGDLKFTVGSPAEAARVLQDRSGRFSQLVYIFAPGNMSYGQLMGFIGEFMKTHPGVYVFL
jgi:hypothetical protein